MEILPVIGMILLFLILGGLAVCVGIIAFFIILNFCPTFLGLFLLIYLWDFNSNLGVLSFIAGITGTYYWVKFLEKIGWYPKSKSYTSYRDDRTQKEILRDIERKIKDPYS